MFGHTWHTQISSMPTCQVRKEEPIKQIPDIDMKMLGESLEENDSNITLLKIYSDSEYRPGHG